MSIARRIGGLFGWKGLLGAMERRKRIMAIVTIAVTQICLTFTQMGFVYNGLDEPFSAYVVVLLMPVAASALLLGTLWGALLGLSAGTLLFVHARFLPLDFHELVFVTPGTSILLLCVSGLLLGLLFGIGLPSARRPLQGFVRVAIPCVVVSFLYTITANAIAVNATVRDFASEASANLTQEQFMISFSTEIALMTFRMGSLFGQALADAVLMVVLCCALDCFVRIVRTHGNNMGVRALFCIWLVDIVSIVFMLGATMCFFGSTVYEFQKGSASTNTEVDYIFGQIDAARGRNAAIEQLVGSLGANDGELSQEQKDGLYVATHPLGSILNGYTLSETGYVAILENDKIVMSNDKSLPEGRNIDEVLEIGGMRALNKSLQSGAMERFLLDEIYTDAYGKTTVSSTQLAYLLARQQGAYTVLIMQTSDSIFKDRVTTMLGVYFVTLMMFLSVIGLVTYLLSTVVGRRIDDIDHTLGRITQGDLEARANVSGTREFKSLSSGINYTVDVLKGWIAEAESRIDAELAAARAIQESALPTTFPAFPHIRKFALYASMDPAKQVGGDFYDFFLLDGSGEDAGRVCFVIADVSGKGIPAALFMMKAKALLRESMEQGAGLVDAVANTNRQLCDGNSKMMFVTTWIGVLDYSTGRVEYVNAGHNLPLFRSHDGTLNWVECVAEPPLGILDGYRHTSHELAWQPQDKLLLYTDGVTEAMNVRDELYGEDRLEDVIRANGTLEPQPLIEAIRASVADYATGAEQSDDITMLSIEMCD